MGFPPPRPDEDLAAERRRPRTWILISLAVLAVVALVFAARTVLGGSCSEEDLSLAETIDHYGGGELEYFDDPESSGCAAALEVAAPADDVLDHYERELEGDGWNVSIQDVPAEGPPGEDVIARDLTARRDGATLTISLESASGQTSAAIRADAG